MSITNRRLKRYVENQIRTILRDKFVDNVQFPYTTSIRTTKIKIEEYFPQKLGDPEIPVVVVRDARFDVSKRVIGTYHLDGTRTNLVVPGVTINNVYYYIRILFY